MSRELSFRRTVVVYQRADAVFDYVSDFGRARDWRSEVVESTATPAGPLRPGTVLREVAVVLNRRIVTETVVDTVDPGRGFTFRHLRGPLSVHGGYTFEPRPIGTAVTYTLTIDLHGNWAMFAPYLRRFGTRSIALSLHALCAIVESPEFARELSPVGVLVGR